MKYKLGDKVRIKSLDWYNQNKDENGFVHCGNRIFDNYMSVFCGSVVTICGEYSYYCGYDVREDMQCRTWTDDMFEGLADAEPQEKMVSLEQVCEWLRNNIDFYVETKYDEDFRVDIEQLLNDICKAM
jgi:hypothetical protein